MVGRCARWTAPSIVVVGLLLGGASQAVAQPQRAQAAREQQLQDRERVIGERRRAALAQLRSFVRDEPATVPELPESLLRLAFLEWEEARARRLAASAEAGPELPLDAAASLVVVARLLDAYPAFPRRDVAWFLRATIANELGDAANARAAYERLLTDHPESAYSADAHFAVGDLIFGGGEDMEGALGHYEAVLSDPETELRDLATFKTAFCLWRLSRVREAAARLREVLDRSQAGDLRRDAVARLVDLFTIDEQNRAADLVGFLRDIQGEAHLLPVLRRLAAVYDEQGRHDRAAEAYDQLLQADGGGPEGPRYAAGMARAQARAGQREESRATLTRLLSFLAADGAWLARHGDQPVVLERARSTAERTLRELALAAHRGAQDAEGQGDVGFRHAAELYRLYLSAFGDQAGAYESQFHLAEILFHRLSEPSLAATAYLGVARMRATGVRTKGALYNAIAALEQAASQCVTQGQAPAECGAEITPRLDEAARRYAEAFPDDPDLPELLLRQGRLHHQAGRFDASVALFGELVTRFPTSSSAGDAGDLLLDSLGRAHRYGDVASWVERLLDLSAFGTEAERARLRTIAVRASFKDAEQRSAEGQHRAAADVYLATAQKYPRHGLAPRAYYNAAIEQRRALDVGATRATIDTLLERFGGSDEAILGAELLAQMYEGLALYGDAAGYHERVAALSTDRPRRIGALHNAAVLFLAVGDGEATLRVCSAFLGLASRGAAAEDVRFLMGRAHSSMGRHAEAAGIYLRYARRARGPDRKIEAELRASKALREAGQEGQARAALERVHRLATRHRQRLRRGLAFAAEARFVQGVSVLARFEAIQIGGDEAGLSSRLRAKAALLSEAAAMFSDVVQFGVAEWLTAALHQIGRSYELFAEAMRAAPIPGGLSPDAEQLYRDELALFIVPMEERALEAFEVGYRRALELGIFNRWTVSLRDGLTRLNDVEYPPFRELGAESGFPSFLPEPAPLVRLHGLARTDAGGRR